MYEHHRRYLESVFQYHINDLPGLEEGMRLDNAAGAVVKHCRGPRKAEKEIQFSARTCRRVAAVHCVVSAFSSKKRPERIGRIALRHQGTGGTHEFPPSLHCVFRHQLHADHHIAGDKVGEVLEEGLSRVLRVELPGLTHRHAHHLQVGNAEACGVDDIDYLAYVVVAVRLNHAESLAPLSFETLPREDVRVVHYFELAGVDCDGGTYEEVGEH